MGASIAEQVSFFAGVAAYLASTVVFFVSLIKKGDGPLISRGPLLLGLAALSHGIYITLASFVAHVCPVESLHFALSVALLATTLIYLALRRVWRIDAVGAFVAPLGMTALLGTRMVGLGDVGQRLPPAFLTLHVAANLLGDGLFLLACVAAGLYLFTEKRLKEKRASSLKGKLPPLDALDRAEHRFLLIGFPLLTVGIVTGTAWASRLEAGHAGAMLRSAFGYLSWLVFAGVLLLRAAAGWRGRRAAWGTIAGFFLAVIVVLVYLVRPAPAAGPRGAEPAPTGQGS